MTQPVSISTVLSVALAGIVATLTFFPSGLSAQAPPGSPPSAQRQFLDRYCAACHNERLKTADLNLVQADVSKPGAHPELWEKVVRKLRTGVMPPANVAQPSEADRLGLLTWLETSLDAASAARPNPGRTETLRRLNRTEYQNAIRDLLALDIDAAALLPKDDAGHGFDNVNVGTLSPTLLDRYITAAQKISRLAVGNVKRVGGDTFRTPPDFSQEQHVQGLPLGTRGGMLIPYAFPQDAEYDVQIRLTRDRNDEVEGLRDRHEVQVLLEREVVASFFVEPPKDRNFDAVDRHLKARISVKAGPHQVGVTFVKDPTSLIEWKRQPYNVHFNM